jgi:hypothetical protein
MSAHKISPLATLTFALLCGLATQTVAAREFEDTFSSPDRHGGNSLGHHAGGAIAVSSSMDDRTVGAKRRGDGSLDDGPHAGGSHSNDDHGRGRGSDDGSGDDHGRGRGSDDGAGDDHGRGHSSDSSNEHSSGDDHGRGRGGNDSAGDRGRGGDDKGGHSGRGGDKGGNSGRGGRGKD